MNNEIKNNQIHNKIEHLFHTYKKLMFKEAYFILNDKYLAEDAVMESFIRIANNFHKISETDEMKTRCYVTKICKNVAKDIYKREHHLNDVSIEEPSIADTDSLELVIQKELAEHVVTLIKKLEPIYRDVLILKYLHDMSRDEIAVGFGIQPETVKKRLLRAKRKIRENLEKELQEEK